MMWTAGFDHVHQHAAFTMPARHDFSVRHVINHASGSVIAGQAVPHPRRITEGRPAAVREG
jgi:hypothetical protein